MKSDTTLRTKICTKNAKKFIRLWVKDNSIGIAPQYQERIFGLFERLHTSQNYPGTGIGLRRGLPILAGTSGIAA